MKFKWYHHISQSVQVAYLIIRYGGAKKAITQLEKRKAQRHKEFKQDIEDLAQQIKELLF